MRTSGSAMKYHNILTKKKKATRQYSSWRQVMIMAKQRQSSAPCCLTIPPHQHHQQVQRHQFDVYKAAVSDSATEKAEKVKKQHAFIKKLTMSQCVVAFDGITNILVSIAGIPLSKLLLSDLMFFCSCHKIKGYRQKKKDDVSCLIAARVASDNIYASIGHLGMTRGCSTVVPTSAGKKRKAYRG